MLLVSGLLAWTITIMTAQLLTFAQESLICTTNSPTGGLLYRINETEGPALPNLILDMSRDLYGDLSQIELSLVENPGDFFRMQGKQLVITKPIDREALSSDVLSLRLRCNYQNGELRFENEIPIGVIIDDVNDNGPTFQKTPYFIQISEDTPVGQTIFTDIQASDNDASSPANDVVYQIVPNVGIPAGAEQFFSIPDPTTGDVVLSRPLDFEATQSYRLVVAAEDNSGNPNGRLRAETTLEVQVLDSNDQAPGFVHPDCRRIGRVPCEGVDYNASVQIGQQPAASGIVQILPGPILAQDSDSLNTPVEYSFVNGTPANYLSYFTIHPESGQVFQLQPVPYGTNRQFIMFIQVKNKGASPDKASFARLTIGVELAENQYDPVLQVNGIVGFLEENAPIGTTVRTSAEVNAEPLQILVTDEDLKPGMPPATYQYILTDPGASLFAVNQGGYVYLNVPSLDVEPPNPESYQITIQAREVGTSPVRSSEPVSIKINILDVNDHAPAFPQPVNNVRAKPGIGLQQILKIQAADADRGEFGDLLYRIASVTNGGESLFRYDLDNGTLVSIGSLSPGQQYQVVLEVQDGGGKRAQAVVVVDVEPETEPVLLTSPQPIVTNAPRPPQFLDKANIVEVPESVQPGELLTQVQATSTRGTEDPLTYAITAGNEQGRFLIDRNNGRITTRLPLDRESVGTYDLVVEAASADGLRNSTTVHIILRDENDNAPHFAAPQPITFQVPDDASPGSMVGTVQAEDLDDGDNSKIRYSLAIPNQYFTVDPSNGTIFTKGDLASAQKDTLVLKITAEDSGNPPLQSTADVLVELQQTRDSPPVFAQTLYEIPVPEDSGPIALTTVEATDPDKTKSITYILKQGDPTLFSVDGRTGIISTLASLNAEQAQVHRLVIGTKENSLSSPDATTTVEIRVVDVNNRIPVFKPSDYLATISDDVQVGSSVLKVTAVDDDVSAPNNVIQYRLDGLGGARNFFTIDRLTGLISVQQSLKTFPSRDIILYAEAIDSGLPALSSTATVAITLTRNTPTPATVPLQTEPVTLGPFVNPPEGTPDYGSSGQPVGVQGDGSTRFEKKDYNILVSEGPIDPYAAQVFTVLNKPADPRLLQCTVGSRGDIPEGLFKTLMTPQGDCELRIFTLDRENVSSYDIPVTISLLSLSNPSGLPLSQYTANVHIAVVDVNDNAPIFSFPLEYVGLLVQPTYFAALAANARPGTKGWLQVSATDADVGQNGLVSYELSDYLPDNQYFKVNNATGVFENAVRLDSVVKNKTAFQYFIMTVEARDNPEQGSPKRARSQVVVNRIEDLNRVKVIIEDATIADVEGRFPNLVQSLQQRAGGCQVIGKESIRDVTKNLKPMTEVTLYFINPRSFAICDRDSVRAIVSDSNTLQEIRNEMKPFFDVARIEGPPPVGRAGFDIADTDGSKWDAAQIALVALACIIALGSIIAIISLCCCWMKSKKQTKRAFYGNTAHEKPSLYTIFPAASQQQSKYNTLYIPPSPTDVPEYETQMLEMAMPEDLPNKDGLDVGFTVSEGVYSIRPAMPNSGLAHVYNQRPYPSHNTHTSGRGDNVVIPPPDYPTGSTSGSDSDRDRSSGGGGGGRYQRNRDSSSTLKMGGTSEKTTML